MKIWHRLANWLIPSGALRLVPSFEDRMTAASYAYRKMAADMGEFLVAPLQQALDLIGNAMRNNADALKALGP